MKRLKFLILIFCLFLSIPVGYFILRTYISLEQEETAKLKYFAETLFDQMEIMLSDFINKEEARAISEYKDINPPKEHYVTGYIQNNPDGSIQTPLLENKDKLESLNKIFNQKKTNVIDTIEPPSLSKEEMIGSIAAEKKDENRGFADKYLSFSRSQKQKSYLGQESKRVEKVTDNLAFGQLNEQKEVSNVQAEIAPMQSVIINASYVFIFRRIMINNEIFRQGVIIDLELFFKYLANTYFITQPMAKFTNLYLKAIDKKNEILSLSFGAGYEESAISLTRNFPRPFSFLRANLICKKIPPSDGRKTLNIMISVLALIILMGLFAIYRSAKTVLDLSDKKARFVSSVTHELKTPLTNIRMYIEMLEQGIPKTIEQEQDYFRILENECARLSRLINNVLEFSKIEQKLKKFDLKEGQFEEVIKEVCEIMQEKLKQEGFLLKISHDKNLTFKYDREVMIQVLINLLENSIKFGKNQKNKEILIEINSQGKYAQIRVEDKGPGIAENDLKKVFDDFYRSNNEITKNTMGTGIGLSLVRRLIHGMGGLVSAQNNIGHGCSISILLPK